MGFTAHEKRFAKRFEAFSRFTQPPHLSYNDYLRGTDFSAVERKDLLVSTSDCFRSVKGLVDWFLDVVVAENCDEARIDVTNKRTSDDIFSVMRREEILAFAKVCVTNSLSLHTLSGSSHASLQFQAHKQFCTVSVAPSRPS